MDLKKMITQFINSTIIDNHNGEIKLKDTDPLLEAGILDSLGIMKLLSFLEETFSVSLEAEDLMPENFETVETLSRFVENKTSYN